MCVCACVVIRDNQTKKSTGYDPSPPLSLPKAETWPNLTNYKREKKKCWVTGTLTHTQTCICCTGNACGSGARVCVSVCSLCLLFLWHLLLWSRCDTFPCSQLSNCWLSDSSGLSTSCDTHQSNWFRGSLDSPLTDTAARTAKPLPWQQWSRILLVKRFWLFPLSGSGDRNKTSEQGTAPKHNPRVL